MNHKSHNGFLVRFAPIAIFVTALVTAFSTSFGGETTLAWDANGEPDLAGYRLHYGLASGAYDQSIDVGNRTEATISNLSSGGTYFFAVTAYNSAGLESSQSNEVSTIIENLPPAVSLTSPRIGNNFAKQTAVAFTAVAGDTDGAIAKVEFFVNGKKVSEDLAAPYESSWSSKTPGLYTILARATDSGGRASDSSTVGIEITNVKTTGGGGKPTGGKTGTYSAATYSALLASPTEDASYAGSLTVTTTEDGSYSGKVKHNGVTYIVKGHLDKEGKTTQEIPRDGAAPLVLTLDATRFEAGELTGTLNDGSGSSGFSAKAGAGKGSQSERSSGRWSVLLPLQDAAPLETPHPQGTGVATLTITKKGIARISGTLADGTSFSQGGQLTASGELLVYVPLYGKQGLLAGSVVFPTADGEVAAGGSAEWIKPPTAGVKKLYPAGFRLNLSVVGEMIPSAAANMVSAGHARASIPAPTQEITLFAGNLPQPVVRTFQPTQSPVAQFVAGAERMKISIKGSGQFSGSFDDSTTTTRRQFIGAYLPTLDMGAGFFLGSDEAGGVILEPID